MDRSIALFWHRRDLRIEDNAGLYKAFKSGHAVQPIFIFDSEILQKLPRDDQRVLFLHREIQQLQAAYRTAGSDLLVIHGNPVAEIPALASRFQAKAVFTNRDYEPYALERDQQIHALLQKAGVDFIGSKDHVIFEKNEIVKADGSPYSIYTPYMRRWKEQLNDFYCSSYPVRKYADSLVKAEEEYRVPELKSMGFDDTQKVDFPKSDFPDKIIRSYHETRDIPSLFGTSRLSLHVRFGTISIRELVRFAMNLNEKYLNELIWRDFYQMILFHFPHTTNASFKSEYDRIRWENNETHFEAWCSGNTGYPLVDAGMRELNATGFMHNRVRMVTASFLTKHLLIDWKWGERYFAEKLLDFDLASNVGGWQWAAGCGCDAAPYFRVFNPTAQQQKFDPEFTYIRKWVPEWGSDQYPKPIIDHAFARERVLRRYKEALSVE